MDPETPTEAAHAQGPALRAALRALWGSAGSSIEARLARAQAAANRLDHDAADALAADVLSATSEPERRAHALLVRAVAALASGDARASWGFAREGLEGTLLDPLLAAELHAQEGVALKQLGLRERALSSNLAALALLEPLADGAAREVLAIVHNNLATLYAAERNLPLAIEHLERGLAVALALDGQEGLVVQQRINLGMLLLRVGRSDEAVSHLASARDLAGASVPEAIRMRVLEGLASARRSSGDAAGAVEPAREALAYWDATGNPLRRAGARLVLGAALAALDDPEAEPVLREGIALAEGHEDVASELAEALALRLEAAGRFEEACLWHRRRFALEQGRLDADRTRAIEELRSQHALERHERENELLRLRTAALEAVVQERTEALREQNRALEVAWNRALDASRAKSAFLAMVSHELRTPLNAIQGYAELVREALDDGDTDAALDDLGNVESASARLRALIERILELTDLETADLGTRETLDVHALLAGLLGPGGSLRCEAGTFPVARRHLEQAVAHLIENAMRFGGEVQVSATLDPGLVVEVADRGPGVDPALLDQLLQPFQQRDMSYTRRHGGLGLGLALVRHHVRLLEGELHAGPRDGGGTVFRITVSRPPG
ncbi:MAG: tetratricopeptide repeat-containing sensor histidine kinase [Alphaproteobacteria bacterium]|nr:tetratricopeptide repeat-containing sensor histidine kinase [Alphaproteobacteria bacterium]